MAIIIAGEVTGIQLTGLNKHLGQLKKFKKSKGKGVQDLFLFCFSMGLGQNLLVLRGWPSELCISTIHRLSSFHHSGGEGRVGGRLGSGTWGKKTFKGSYSPLLCCGAATDTKNRSTIHACSNSPKKSLTYSIAANMNNMMISPAKFAVGYGKTTPVNNNKEIYLIVSNW